MAQGTRNKPTDLDEENAGGSAPGRILVWAGMAAIALGSAALAAQTQIGADKLVRILGHDAAVIIGLRPAPATTPVLAVRPTDAEVESRRLAEAVRLLAADRDRLLARVDALERNLDVTASVPPEAAPPVQPPAPILSAPPTWSLVPETMPPAAGVPAGGIPATALPPAASRHGSVTVVTIPAHQAPRGPIGLIAPEPAQESVATKTEFGVDIGGDASFDGLRSLWTAIRGSHASLFEGLRPVVAVREGGRPGALELRLVVGPLSNAGSAARLCASLSTAGVTCQPTVFDGQRLALR
jgi:hypothetical protein